MSNEHKQPKLDPIQQISELLATKYGFMAINVEEDGYAIVRMKNMNLEERTGIGFLSYVGMDKVEPYTEHEDIVDMMKKQKEYAKFFGEYYTFFTYLIILATEPENIIKDLKSPNDLFLKCFIGSKFFPINIEMKKNEISGIFKFDESFIERNPHFYGKFLELYTSFTERLKIYESEKE